MDIVLKKPIEEITPKLIEFNNVELMAQANAYLQRYENMLFDDSTIAEAKEAKAEINKISSELNKWRISIQKIYETPSKHFKSQVDEVINKFDNVSAKIGETINDFVERQKEEKRDKINAIYLEVFGTLIDVIPLEKLYNSRWENKTYSVENITKDITDMHERITQDIEAIYNMKDIDTIALKYLYYKSLNLSVALNEYNREEQSKAFIKQQEEQKRASVIDWNKKVESGAISEPTPLKEPSTQTRVIRFSVELTNTQAQALKKFFIDNNIKYEKI